MARRKRKNLNKRKNGGAGTAVGNLLRRAIQPLKAGVGINTLPTQTASVNNFRITTAPNNPSQVIPSGSIVSPQTQRNAERGRLSPMQLGNLNSSPAPRLGPASVDPLSTRERISQNTAGGGNPLGPDVPQDISSRLEANTGEGGQTDAQGRSYESGVTIPSYSGSSKPSAPTAPAPAPTPEFARGGVSNFKSAPTTTGGGLSTALGQLGGGVKGEGITGTAIKDDYYANLLNQLEKDSQDNVDLDDIRRQNEQRAQAEINSINAIYSDLVGRAQRTGEENLGSERAINARSGTLGSSFGQDALQREKAETNKNIGEIENQKASTIADIYSRSRENALNEYQVMKDLKSKDFETYKAVQAQERAILDGGLNDMAEYMALQGLSAEDLDMEGLKSIAKDWKSTPEKVYNAIMAKQAELQQRDIDQREQMGEFDKTTGANSGGSYDESIQESIALSVLPVQLKNSVAESDYYKGIIRQGLADGRSAYEIADALMGYNISNPDNFTDNLRTIIGQGDLSSSEVSNIARLVNKGDTASALRKAELGVMKEAKKTVDGFTSDNIAINAYDRASELQNYVSGLSESKYRKVLGNVSGTIENNLGKLRKKEASEIKSQITQLTAKMRNTLLGSAVTPTEEAYLAPLIPDISDKPDVFLSKIQRLASEPLRELNSIRTTYGLIPLTFETLKNINLRVEDYYGMQSSAPQNTQSTSNSGGGGNWDW